MDLFDRFDHERFLQTIYDAADEPDGFQEVVRICGEQYDSEKSHLILIGPGSQPVMQAFSGGCEEEANIYLRDWHAVDPRFHIAVANPGLVLSDVDVLEPETFERSFFHNEFMRGIGMRYTLFTNQPSRGDYMLATAFMRPRDRGHYGAEHATSFAMLAPHIGRAARLQAMSRALAEKNATLESALDNLPVSVALVDAHCRLVFASASARRLLDEAEGIHLDGGRLSAHRMKEAETLEKAVLSAARFADLPSARASSPPACSVRISRRDGGEDVVSVFPLRSQNALRSQAKSSEVLLILHDPRRGSCIERADLCQRFGLTLTEAEVAATLAEGGTLATFASHRGCSLETARTHLKRVLRKTGTNRQADLVRTILNQLARQVLPSS